MFGGLRDSTRSQHGDMAHVALDLRRGHPMALTEPERMALCTCSYPYWLHEGKNKTCVVAVSRCEGFKPKPAPAAEPTADATLRAQLAQMRANDAADLDEMSDEVMKATAFANRHACLSMGDGTYRWVDRDGNPTE